MLIRYKKSRLRLSLILGLFWFLIGFSSFLIDNSFFSKYGGVLIGTLYLSIYFFEIKKQFLKIEEGVLTKNSLFPKRIHLSDIIQIKKFAGDITLITDTDKMLIHKDLINPESFKELELVLQGLALKKQV